MAATALAVIPDWPWFNRDPLTWLPVKEVVASKGEDDGSAGSDDAVADADAPSGSGARSGSPTTRQRRLPVIE